MNKYLLSKISFGFFGTTTVMIFMSLYSGGAFIDFVGSIEAAIVVYAINTCLLLVSLFWYIWEKAHKDTPKHNDIEILEAFAKREAADTKPKENSRSLDISTLTHKDD